MKTKIIFYSLFLLFISAPTKAQVWEFVGLDSLLIKQIYASGDTIWAATDARINTNMVAGVYKSIDGGVNWFQLDSTLGDGTAVNFYKDSERNFFLLIKGMSGGVNIAGTLYKSTNSGANWTIIQQLENISVDWIGISDFNKNEIYARESHYIVAGWYETVYRSTDGGTNWQEITYLPASSHGRRLTFNLSLSDSNKLYAAVDDMLGGQYFYKSTNKGVSWIYISEPFGIPSELINDSELSERIYTSSIYISEDGGYTWEIENSGLTDTSYYLSFYECPLNKNEIYTLRSDGLYKSAKDNIYWNRIEGTEYFPLFSYGYIFEDVGELKNVFVDSISKVIYVGTAKGIYKRDLITEVELSNDYQPYQFTLYQNYPNPFNPSTIINYSIKENGLVTLKVFDVLGKEVQKFVDEDKEAGSYLIDFDASDLPSGIYFYTIQSGNFSASNKMILLK